MTDQERITLYLTQEQKNLLLEEIEERIGMHGFWADNSAYLPNVHRHRQTAVTLDAIAAQLKEQTDEQ